MIHHYLKIAIRNLLKYKTQHAISIVGLAVGLLCFTVCLYCTRFVENFNHCFPNHQRIAELYLYDNRANHYFSGTPVSMAEELRTWWNQEDAEAITSVTFPHERPYSVEVSADKTLPYDLATIEVDTFYNRVFTPELTVGNWNVAIHSTNAVIMSRSTAIKIFGKVEEAVGKHLTLMRRLPTSPQSTPRTGGITYTVQAIMEDIPLNNGFNFMKHIDMLTVNDSEGLMLSPKRREMTGSNTYVLLSPHTRIADLEQQFSRRNYTYKLYDTDYSVVASNIGKQLQNKNTDVLAWTTGIIGLLILLVGLINFFHFLIGSFFNRTKEYSIIKVLGCNQRQLFYQLFTQSSLTVVIASLLVFCGIEWIDHRMDFSLMDISMTFSPRLLRMHVLQYTLVILIICAFVSFLISLRIRRLTVRTGIYGSDKRKGKQWMRNLLLGMQFSICWIFVTLTVSLYLQSETTSGTLFNTLNHKEKNEILSIPLDYIFLKNEEKLALVERFRQHSGVKDLLLSDISYLNGISGNQMMTEKGNDNSWTEIQLMSVPVNFFSFMNIAIEQGRGIHTPNDIVVDRTYWESLQKDVIGMALYDRQKDYTVCGICAPFQTDVYERSSGFAFLLYHPSEYVGHCYVKCRSGQVKEVRHWVENILREVLPENISVHVQTLQDDIHDRQALEYQLKDIILFFAIVSVIITLLGVYSSITLDTERRQKEVAIRKVNGAGFRQVIWLFVRLYIILLASSALIAFPLLYALLTLWKRLYTVFFSYNIFFWSGIFLSITLITGFTIFFRIRKTAKVNPAEVIKNE